MLELMTLEETDVRDRIATLESELASARRHWRTWQVACWLVTLAAVLNFILYHVG